MHRQRCKFLAEFPKTTTLCADAEKCITAFETTLSSFRAPQKNLVAQHNLGQHCSTTSQPLWVPFGFLSRGRSTFQLSATGCCGMNSPLRSRQQSVECSGPSPPSPLLKTHRPTTAFQVVSPLQCSSFGSQVAQLFYHLPRCSRHLLSPILLYPTGGRCCVLCSAHWGVGSQGTNLKPGGSRSSCASGHRRSCSPSRWRG